MEQDIRRALATAGVRCADASLLTELGQAATKHALSAKEIASRYDVFLLNK
jgi:hypothetical protein